MQGVSLITQKDSKMAAKTSDNNVTPINTDLVDVQKTVATYVPSQPNIVDPIDILLDPAEPDKYKLRLDFRAMREIEKKTGDIMWDGSIFENGVAPTPEKLLVYIWACLLWQHPKLTTEDVEILPGFHMMNMPYLTDRFYANWNLSMPDPATIEADSSDKDDKDPN